MRFSSAPSAVPNGTARPRTHRPEQALLGLRKALGLFANVRPVKAVKELVGASTLRPEVIAGVDWLSSAS